jgi:hypothetical protein
LLFSSSKKRGTSQHKKEKLIPWRTATRGGIPRALLWLLKYYFYIYVVAFFLKKL